MARSVTWCVTGASGQLGGVLVRQLVEAGEEVVALSGRRTVQIAGVRTSPIDITDHQAVRRILEQTRPSVVVHLAAVSSVGEALSDPKRARQVNVDATDALVALAGRVGARLICASTDLVFDGQAPPYDESSCPDPVNCYGRSKFQAEPAVLNYGRGVVVRPSLMFGLPVVPRQTTFCQQLVALRDGRTLRLFEDEFRTPLWFEDAARAIRAIGRSDFVGLMHLAGPERTSRLDMGVAMAVALGLPTDAIQAVTSSSMSFPEPRPADVSLDGSLFERTFPDVCSARTVREAVAGIRPDELAGLAPGPSS